MSRAKWTTILVVAGVATLLAALATPVAARPKPKPPDTVNVTMTYVGAGIATTCEFSSLTMRREGHILRADWAEANTEVRIELPIKWERSYGPDLGGDSVTGCHGGLIEGSGTGFAGYFILAPNRRQGTVELTSRFDYYWKYEPVKKGRQVQTALELFEINAELTRVDGDGEPFDWTPGAGEQEVIGTLEMLRFDKVDGWVSFGSVAVTMTIAITD